MAWIEKQMKNTNNRLAISLLLLVLTIARLCRREKA